MEDRSYFLGEIAGWAPSADPSTLEERNDDAVRHHLSGIQEYIF